MENSLIKMLESGQYSDLKIVVGKNDHKLEFTAHKVILVGSSGYFEKACGEKSGFKENQEGIVNLPDTDPRIFGYLLDCLYKNSLDKEMRWEDVARVYEEADYFDIRSIKVAVVSRINENLWNFDTEGGSIPAIKSCLAHYRVADEKIVGPIFDKLREGGGRLVRLLKREDVQDILRKDANLAVFALNYTL